MAKLLFDNEIRDTNTYDTSNDRTGGTETDILFHIVNDLDDEITVTFYGTRGGDDGSWNDIVQLGQNTVSANSVGYETLADPWEIAYMEIVASSSPTSGSAKIYQME